MTPTKHPRETRSLGKPVDWDDVRDGPCGYLSISDIQDAPGVPRKMESHWLPEPWELEALNAGGVVVLGICGTMHPPVSVGVRAAI